MFKIRPYLINACLACFDICFVAAGYVLAWKWERSPAGLATTAAMTSGRQGLIPLFALITWVALSIYFQLYRSRRTGSIFADTLILLKVCAASLVILQFGTEWFAALLPSRYFLLRFAGITLLFLGVARIAVRLLLRRLRELGYNTKRVVVVAAPSLYERLARKLEERADYGYHLAWGVQFPSETAPTAEQLLAQFFRTLATHEIDDAILALSGDERAVLGALAEQCENHGVHVRIVPDLFPLVQSETQVASLDGIPLVNVRPYRTEDFSYVVLKRVFDVAFSLAVLILLSPFLLVIALLVKLTSEGSILIIQERVGLNARKFKLYKFRTMRNRPASETESHWTTPNDASVTPLGRCLRRSNLDELPQFLNVLKGDMSIVGPRPERPFFIERFRKQIPGYMLRHYVKCGITGWAQVNGWRGDTSIHERIVHDLYYIRNWGLSFDLKIILLTLTRSFFHRNAY
jgi:Undecaprenyl-phosphate glucose phosphotransferase